MSIGKSGIVRFALAGAIAFAAFTVTPDMAQAHKKSFSLYVGPGSFGLSIGPRYGYGYYPYYRPYYQPYYYEPRRYYVPRRRVSRCGYWARRCADRWGWYNHNWRGCMRYSGCR